MLQAGRGQNVSVLAEACGVSRRTVFRDLNALRQAGVPLIFDESAQRYTLSGSAMLPHTNFTSEEALALLVLCHELGSSSGVPFYAAARSAAFKIEACLPDNLRDRLRRLADTIQIKLEPRGVLEQSQQIYERLIDATTRRQCVRITYRSLAEQDTISTRLSPYRILFSRRSWYTIGRSSVHRETRTFNVSRITELELLDETYEIPPRFNLEKYLRNAWHLVPEPGPDSDVLVRFQPLVAQNVAEVMWHKTQRIKCNKDGTIDFHATVSGVNEIAWWILGYGDQAETLKPAKLRKLVARRCRMMAAMYEEG